MSFDNRSQREIWFWKFYVFFKKWTMLNGIFYLVNVVDPFVVVKDINENFVLEHFRVLQKKKFCTRMIFSLNNMIDSWLVIVDLKEKSNLEHFHCWKSNLFLLKINEFIIEILIFMFLLSLIVENFLFRTKDEINFSPC